MNLDTVALILSIVALLAAVVTTLMNIFNDKF